LGVEPAQASGEDGDEGDLDEGDEVLLRPLDNGVQSTVAADPAEGAPHDPGDFGRDEHAVATAGNRLDASPRGTLLRVSPARFDATVECAGTPALPCLTLPF